MMCKKKRVFRSFVIGSFTPLLWCAVARADSFVLSCSSATTGTHDVLVDPLPSVAITVAQLGLLPGDVVDGISDGNDKLDPAHGAHDYLFSVMDASVGLGGSGVFNEFMGDTAPPGGPNGNPADIFLWIQGTTTNQLAPAGSGAFSGTGGDEANAGLVTSFTAPPGDDIRAYESSTLPTEPPSSAVYFSLEALSPTLYGPDGAPGVAGVDDDTNGTTDDVSEFLWGGSDDISPGTIFAVGGSFGATPVVYMSHTLLGFPANVDIDALSVEVVGAATYVAFSVYKDTVGWTTGSGAAVNSGAQIIFYPPGGPTTVALGPAQLGLQAGDDIDALESFLYVPSTPTPEEYEIEMLPELGGLASEASDAALIPLLPQLLVVGKSLDLAGNWQATAWVFDDVQGFELTVLPGLFPSRNSRANALFHQEGSEIIAVSGSSEDIDGHKKPVIWSRVVDMFDIFSILDTLGGNEGEVLDICSSGEDGLAAAGYATAMDGTPKAALWLVNGPGDSVLVGLPELGGPAPGKESRANAVSNIEESGVPITLVVGGAQDDEGQLRPVIWIDNGNSTSIIPLPLLDAGLQGEVTAIGIHHEGSEFADTTVVGWSETFDGHRHAVRWDFANGPASVEDLGVLEGYNNSEIRAVQYREADLFAVGSSHNQPGDGRATLFLEGQSPIDLNELVVGELPMILRSARAAMCQGLGEQDDCFIVGHATAEGAEPGGPGSEPHAYVLLEVIQQCETDTDGDGVCDDEDPCPLDNPDDTDADGICDSFDNCPFEPNPDQADCDQDGIGDVCAISSGASEDCNGNGVPDECEEDPCGDCPTDLDGDAQTGASDLAYLLGSWGPCAVCDDCPADFNDDCIVNAADLASLLGGWGPCN